MAKHDARALANLHSLNISPEHHALLFRNPMELRAEQIQTKPTSANNKHIIDKLLSKMSQMEGVPVFENLFIEEYKKVSGVTLNKDNLDTMRAYRDVSSKLAVDSECDEALKVMDKVDLEYCLNQHLRHQERFDFSC